MVSTFLLIGLIVGFGIAQIPYIKNKLDNKASVVAAGAGQQAQQPQRKAEDPPLLSADQMAKILDDDDVKGEANAPVTIVEFSDFQCPFCARFVFSTIPPLEETYIKTGKVKFAFRDYPLPFHKQSPLASMAAECAHEQGKFWEMHDTLFGKQEEWSENDKAPDLFNGYAKELGLDAKNFNVCVSSQKYDAEIKKDTVDGAAAGVDGTPTFFINGKLISGALPFDKFMQPIIEAELAGKKWQVVYEWAQNLGRWVPVEIKTL